MDLIHFFIGLYLSNIIPVFGSIDLFITQDEVQRILGFKGELFYIRDGEVNHNAIKYKLLVPENANKLTLRWQDKMMYSRPTKYYTTINTTSNNNILSNVNTSLTSSGKVPSEKPTDFHIEMVCNPKVNGSELVQFYLDLTVPKPGSEQSKYHLIFNFDKKCQSNDDEFYPVTPTDKDRKDTNNNDQNKKSNKTNTFYVAVGITLSVILLVIMAFAYLHIRSMPKEDENGVHDGIDTESKEALMKPSQAIPETVRMIKAEQQIRDIMINMKDFTVRRSLLSIANTTQEGSFGRTYVGTLISAESGEEFKVSVKTITDQATPDQIVTFLSEAIQLKRTTHPNVLPLMHICCEGNFPLVIYPYMNRGNLKNYLRLSRTVEPLSRPLTTRDIVNIALQIARGLYYLCKRRMVYKDVATRNCVVDEELHVKISDNALSRDFFPGDYHCIRENENRPVRWMAVESLDSDEYSPASDVWSYGVLLWELCSLAQTPYASVDPFEMLSYLQSGLRLPQPPNCPDDFFTVMACCWALSPEERPHFQQIIACLDAFLNKLNAFI